MSCYAWVTDSRKSNRRYMILCTMRFCCYSMTIVAMVGIVARCDRRLTGLEHGRRMPETLLLEGDPVTRPVGEIR